MVFAIHLMGISSIMGAINIIVTILNMRAPEMTLLRMPLFVWTWLITAFLLIGRHAGAGRRGDDAAHRQVLRHVVLQRAAAVIRSCSSTCSGSSDIRRSTSSFSPAFGIVSQIIPPSAASPVPLRVDGVRDGLDCVHLVHRVGHHMFTVGMPLSGELFFMYTTMLIAVPTGVKVFNWIATMWRSSMSFETPMLWAIAFVILFTIGGFSGLMLAITPVDFQYHDTYFVVAHFHYVLVTGAISRSSEGRTTGCRSGRPHVRREAREVALLALDHLGQRAVLPQHFLGLAGMPRRIPDYAVQFTDWNLVSSIGGFAFGLSQLLFLYIVVQTIRGGERAPDRVWEGAHGLEWTLASPPPYHTFEEPPHVTEAEAHG